MSPQTGIIFNDEMDDFSAPNITNGFGVPPSPRNFIRPQKRPLSSMCPTIVIDDQTGNVKLVTGASGGTKITSQTALVVYNFTCHYFSMLIIKFLQMTLRNIWLNRNIKEATDETRIHHQLAPMILYHGDTMSEVCNLNPISYYSSTIYNDFKIDFLKTGYCKRVGRKRTRNEEY
jgi:gamma-glutamyltranspeptidase/glutathione hydrolase/leukotriene-C4 hydrolase